MLTYLTAGESHGQALVAIMQGIPANLKIDVDKINSQLALRCKGFGRGGRMAIESDKIEILAGVRGGITTGAPIAFIIENKDYKNWQDIIGVNATKLQDKKLTAVRPGHADLAGCIKYNQKDARNILERASARNTATQVAIGEICNQFLAEVGITTNAKVLSIGGESEPKKIREKIELALALGDTLGGKIEVLAQGLFCGLGSYISSPTKLEYSLAANLMAIQSVKSVSIGNVEKYETSFGGEVHDELYLSKQNKIVRKTNNAGGIEGGMSNGEDIVATIICKPIPSVPKGLSSVDIESKKQTTSAKERGDAVAIEAASVVAKSVLSFVLAKAVLNSTGGDHMDEIKERVKLKRKAML